MPDDARIVGAMFDMVKDQIVYLVESETFDEVVPGAAIPELEVSVRVDEHVWQGATGGNGS